MTNDIRPAVRVLYTGPLLAGVSASVHYLAHVQQSKLDEYPRHGFTATNRDGLRIRIHTDVRSPYYFRTSREALATCDSTLRPSYRAHIEYLREVDGVVFVADSQTERTEATLERIDRLRIDLEDAGRDVSAIPVVFQCNKRDLPNVRPLDEMAATLQWPRCDHRPSVAVRGEGVLDALRTLVTMTTAAR